MSEEIMPSRLLVDLDSIFDTRLSVLYSISPDLAEQAIKSGYLNRVSNKYPDISIEAFNERYNARTKADLKNALVTPIIKLVSDFAYTTISNSLSGPIKERPVIVLNTYPYVLSEEENKLFINLLFTTTRTYAEIEIINLSPDDITPRYLKDNFNLVIMYNGLDWLELHASKENFKKTICPDIGLISPATLDHYPSDTKLVELTRMGVELFEGIEKTASPLIALSLINASNFSSLALENI
jgi:hypothetical protein